MDSIVHIEQDKVIGVTRFKGGLLQSSIVMAVRDVEGVAAICTINGNVIKKKALKKGVRVIFSASGMTIDVYLWSVYGYSSSDIAYRVQESVINIVSNLIQEKVINVNVRFNGVQSKAIA